MVIASKKKIILSGPETPPASGREAKQLIVFLHGVGADGNDLIGLADSFAEKFPDAHFISPNGPFSYDMAPFGYQWFSLAERTKEKMLQGAAMAESIVNDFLDTQLARFSLTEKNLALIGFSQGTMMALYSALRRKNPVAGIVGNSGAFLHDAKLNSEIKSKPPVCLIHGMDDQVVPLLAMIDAKRQLENLGVSVETHERPALGHGIDAEGIGIGIKFLLQHLKK